MTWRPWIHLALATALVAAPVACDRSGSDAGGEAAGDAQVDEALGSLRVANRVNEPIAIHLDGQELFVVPPGESFTFRNLPTRTVDVYGVGRISQKHYGLPRLTIESGGSYEWTIEP